MSICWINGAFVAEAEAHVSIFDRGLLFGDGVYEVAAVFGGRLLDADLHLRRLERSLTAIGMTAPQSESAWLDIMQSLAEQNGIDEGLVYIQVTRGTAERDFTFPANATPTMFAFARKKSLTNDPNAKGVSLHAVDDIRWVRRDIKSVSMLAQVLAKQAAKAAGAFEAIMHEDGVVTEGGSSNLWIVQNGTIITRSLSHDILAGITREVILGLAQREHIAIEERSFTIAEANAASECFLTSATNFLIPVTRIDQVIIGDGTPGPLSTSLRAAYFARAAELVAVGA
jgi:D-alanine transaminase